MTKQLTEMQQKFLDVLFEEAAGNFAEAKRMAGYSDNVSVKNVVTPLEEEIMEATRKYLLRSGVKAAVAVNNIIDAPTELGNKEKLAAAKDILDRAGFKPTDKVEVKTSNPLFILPSKGEETDE
jgi:hypothetical protein